MRVRAIALKRRPNGLPETEDFDVCEVDAPPPEAGEIEVRNVCMSVDPYMRGRMYDRKSCVPPFQIGEVLSGGSIGEVLASAHPDFKEGDFVSSSYGWREGFTAPAAQVERLGKIQAPPSAYLGALGMPGMTAYVGLLEIGALQDGESVFVSGAAGAVGSVAGQIAKIRGCSVIGSAGTDDKARLLTEELGFDYGFNYKEGCIVQHLRQAAPKGLDVYFDNVGSDHLQAALVCMRPNGRIPLCGAISTYNDAAPRPGPDNLSMAIGIGLTLRGFIVSNFMHRYENFRSDMEKWVNNGQIKTKETILGGIESAPDAFIGLFTGVNVGKMIVSL